MKKYLSVILVIVLALSAVIMTSCGKSEEKLDEVRVFTLMGPTGMGMAKLISDSKEGKTSQNYKFTIASAPDQISAEVIKGDFEIAAVPVNLASVLYNKT